MCFDVGQQNSHNFAILHLPSVARSKVAGLQHYEIQHVKQYGLKIRRCSMSSSHSPGVNPGELPTLITRVALGVSCITFYVEHNAKDCDFPSSLRGPLIQTLKWALLIFNRTTGKWSAQKRDSGWCVCLNGRQSRRFYFCMNRI